MLWREGYAPKFADSVLPPVLTGRALDESDVVWRGPTVGVFGPRALANIGIWARLFRSEKLDFRIALLDVPPRSGRDLFAPSERSIVVVPSDRSVWEDFLPQEAHETTFAVTSCGAAAMLLVGPPTEDAWERFVDRIRS